MAQLLRSTATARFGGFFFPFFQSGKVFFFFLPSSSLGWETGSPKSWVELAALLPAFAQMAPECLHHGVLDLVRVLKPRPAGVGSASPRDRQKLGVCHPARATYSPCNTRGLGWSPTESPKSDLNSLQDRGLHCNSCRAAYAFLFCLVKNDFPLFLRPGEHSSGRCPALA